MYNCNLAGILNALLSNKIEYVEDREKIIDNGLYEKSLNSLGTSTKTQAHRVAEYEIQAGNLETETINFQCRIKRSLLSNHEIYIKPLPLKNVPGIINDYIEVNLQKNYVTKLVAANIKLFDTNIKSMPELIQCRINNTVPNLELSYRGITLSALILPKHVAPFRICNGFTMYPVLTI